MSDPTRFIDGEPIPDGYLPTVHQLINEVCDIEDQFPDWELEAYLSNQRTDHADLHRTRVSQD